LFQIAELKSEGGVGPNRRLYRISAYADSGSLPKKIIAAMPKHGIGLIADNANFTNVKRIVYIDEILLDTEVKAAA
jgi:hypothetical protein